VHISYSFWKLKGVSNELHFCVTDKDLGGSQGIAPCGFETTR
jgi:hypothetical protein